VCDLLFDSFLEIFRGVVPKCLRAGLAGVFSGITMWLIMWFSDDNKRPNQKSQRM
jgi:hypothetical protein